MFIWETIQNNLAILPKFVLIFVLGVCYLSVILFLIPIISPKSFTSTVIHPTPTVHRHGFSLVSRSSHPFQHFDAVHAF